MKYLVMAGTFNTGKKNEQKIYKAFKLRYKLHVKTLKDGYEYDQWEAQEVGTGRWVIISEAFSIGKYWYSEKKAREWVEKLYAYEAEKKSRKEAEILKKLYLSI